jgi:23S rRNA (cytidine1920-2'-O)/16S rRNA (cytidine1409-2'-O)-methyltransferase
MVARGLAQTRAKAQGLILAGRVLLAGRVETKCGAVAGPDQEIAVSPSPRPFVSRGGEKLAGALDDLGISVTGAVVLDVGASTGGFTDCLLRRGAVRVFAVDVGESLLDDSLRRDPRVVVLERVIKPQFEAGKGSVGKGGVVRDETERRRAVLAVGEFAREAGFSLLGEAESRVKGPKGNREVFLYLRWP